MNFSNFAKTSRQSPSCLSGQVSVSYFQLLFSKLDADAGLSLDGKSVEEADMGPIIQQAIDQINFAIGATTTAPGKSRTAQGTMALADSISGKIRAAMGHAAAFTALTFIEVGSEVQIFFDLPSRNRNSSSFPGLYGVRIVCTLSLSYFESMLIQGPAQLCLQVANPYISAQPELPPIA